MFVYNAARWFECQPDFTFPFEQTKVDTDYRPQGHSPQGRWDCTHHSYWKCWRIGTSQNHFQQCWNLHARLGNMPTINPPLLPTLLFYYRSKSNSAWIFFSGVCGNITFANDNNHQTRFAFIKFEKREIVKTAVEFCNGVMLGDRAIKSVTWMPGFCSNKFPFCECKCVLVCNR